MFGFTELEEHLLGPESASVLGAALETLVRVRDEVKAQISAGLAPADYETAQMLLAAVNASERIMIDTTHLKGVQR